MGMLVQLRQQWAGAFICCILLVVWAGDIFAPTSSASRWDGI
jgi:hypothetical protein